MRNARMSSVVGAMLGATATSAIQIIPHADARCAHPVNGTYDGSPGRHSNNYFDIGLGYVHPGGVPWFMNTDFPGAHIPKLSSAYNVWWDVPEPPEGCHIAMMVRYSQDGWNHLPDGGVPPGNVVMNVDQGGCYYSSIPKEGDFAASWCCGASECTPLSAGNAGIISRDLEAVGAPKAEEQDQAKRQLADAKTSLTERRMSSREDVARNALSEVPGLQKRTDCVAAIVTGPWSEAGHQTMVANTQTCTSTSCYFMIQHAFATSTTLTSTTTQEITTSIGTSVSVTAGSELFGLQETVEFSFEYAESIGYQTSTAYQNMTTVTVTNNIGQALGTTAFATFTPTYLCWTATVDCGAGPSDPFIMCNPQVGSDGTGMQGDYQVVYT